MWQQQTGTRSLDGTTAPQGVTDEALAEQRLAFRDETRTWTLTELQDALIEHGVGDHDIDTDESYWSRSSDGDGALGQSVDLGIVAAVWAHALVSGS